jgi:hypothetical protein
MGVLMRSKYFTKSEAGKKVGKTIQTMFKFAEVPAGTCGTVITIYKANWDDKKGYGVNITWKLPCPVTDGFSKDEYEEFLVEV